MRTFEDNMTTTKRTQKTPRVAALLRGSSYTEMTLHGTRTRRTPAVTKTKSRDDHSHGYFPQHFGRTVRKTAAQQSVPDVGQRINVDLTLIVQEEENGVSKTPMTKIRFFQGEGWKQVPRTEAGMFVFFNNEPQANHAGFVVTSIIPSKTACYADLVH